MIIALQAMQHQQTRRLSLDVALTQIGLALVFQSSFSNSGGNMSRSMPRRVYQRPLVDAGLLRHHALHAVDRRSPPSSSGYVRRAWPRQTTRSIPAFPESPPSAHHRHRKRSTPTAIVDRVQQPVLVTVRREGKAGGGDELGQLDDPFIDAIRLGDDCAAILRTCPISMAATRLNRRVLTTGR